MQYSLFLVLTLHFIYFIIMIIHCIDRMLIKVLKDTFQIRKVERLKHNRIKVAVKIPKNIPIEMVK